MIAPEIRATLAAVALAHNTGKTVTELYDYSAKTHRDIRASFNGKTLDGFDTGRAAKLSGDLPDIYDHVLQKHIHLTQEEGRYAGFDHHSGTHFHIMLNGDTASLYDHDAATWSQYSL